jgi:cyclophilin family peptidyl-prolyl cis-trans isomerase
MCRLLYGTEKRFFRPELRANRKHTRRGTVSMATMGSLGVASQVRLLAMTTPHDDDDDDDDDDMPAVMTDV